MFDDGVEGRQTPMYGNDRQAHALAPFGEGVDEVFVIIGD
jgi:hypothetical protein